MLDRPDISLEEKAILKSIIYDKPHFPYIRRHEFSSEIAPRVSQQAFNQLLGHSKTSRMYEVYVHELGTEGNRELMIARGIIDRQETISSAQLKLQPKYCPICHESNKQEADFCFKCNWVISKKGMQEVREKDEAAVRKADEKEKELQSMKESQQRMMEFMKVVETKLAQVDKQLQAQNTEMREVLS